MSTKDPREPVTADEEAPTIAPPPSAGDVTLASQAPGPGSGEASDYRSFFTVNPAHYERGREIARGGMGRIVVARDRRLGRQVALKENLALGGDLLARFEREARITARLQHPAIVSLHEAGTWPDGRQFFAMKLVAGRSLDKVIAEKRTLAERLSLLPHVIAAVDALAYAHAQRIIHRDLKPANLLVGDYGETVVIDWGIAKDLASGDSFDTDAARRRSEAASGETLAGSVLGTPAYMPPEQARGLAVDERADVYALGALLYHLLAARPPFTGNSTEDVLLKVMNERPPPIAMFVADVPPDLITIVDKAMAPAPVDRYPTAQGMAEDLKRFQTGGLVGAHRYTTRQLVRRWLRRHRAAATVAAVLLAALAAISAFAVARIVSERDTARHERALAEERKRQADTARGAAEKLVESLLRKLREQVEPLGRLDVFGGVARSVLDYYDSVKDQVAADRAAQLRRARALEAVGDVASNQADTAGAAKIYGEAWDVRKRLAGEAPDDREAQAALANSELIGATIALAQGKKPEAEALAQSARARFDKLRAAEPEDLQRRRDLSRADSVVGNVALSMGKADDAEAAYRRMLAIREPIAAARPDDNQVQGELAYVHSRLAQIALYRRSVAEGLAEYRQALALRRKVAERDPMNSWAQNVLASVHADLGAAQLGAGDLDAALAELGAAAEIEERLVAHDPTNVTWRTAAVQYRVKVGEVQSLRGDMAPALATYRQAVGAYRTLIAVDASNLNWQASLVDALLRTGNVQYWTGELGAAKASYEDAQRLIDDLVARDPANINYQNTEGIVAERFGQVAYGAKDFAAAAAAYGRERDVYTRMVEKWPDLSALKSNLAFAWQNLGDLAADRHDLDEAERAAMESFRLRKALLDLDPSCARCARDVQFSWQRRGKVAFARGQREASVAAHREALAIAEALVAKDPTNVAWQVDLAEDCSNLGEALGREGRDEARRLVKRGLDIMLPLEAAKKLAPRQAEIIGELRKVAAALGEN